MTTIPALQSLVGTDQANLQLANTALAAANSNLNTALVSNNAAAQTQAQADINTTATQVASAKTQLATDQAALDAATATSPAPPSSIALAPENSQAPVTIDPSNGQIVTNYGTPTSSQLATEAATKIASTGQTTTFSSVSQGISIVTANGSANAVSVSTGQTITSMGTVQPTGNTLPPNTIPTSTGDNTQLYKVTISQEPQLTGDASALLASNKVVFDVMPAISETGEASYKSFTPIQHPGEILKYDGSASRQWGITAKLVSRNVAEADLNLAYINLIRSWRMPFYGTGTGTPNTQTAEFLGAPPPILTLTAYGAQMIGPVKCVMLQYSWNWPNEIDYIHTSSGVPFPVIIDVSLSLKESYSPAEYSKFDLLQFRNGNLPAAFGGATTTQMSALGQSTPAPPSAPTSPTTPMNASAIDTSQSPKATVGQVTSANKSQQSAVQSAAGGTKAVSSVLQTIGTKLIQKVVGQI